MLALVATDLSDTADEAIRQGHAWAQRRGAKLAVCHVIPGVARVHPFFPQDYEQDAQSSTDIQMSAAEVVRARVCEVSGRDPEDFAVIIDAGSPDESVVRAADRTGASLLFIGGYGTSDMPHLLLGSVARYAIKNAACPVLVVRRTESTGPVLLATDLSDASGALWAIAAEEAKGYAARLAIVHSLDVIPTLAVTMLGPGADDRRDIECRRERVRDELAARAHSMAVEPPPEIVVCEGLPADEIVRAAVERQARLVVVGRGGPSAIAKLGLGRVADQVVRLAPCSVLVVPL